MAEGEDKDSKTRRPHREKDPATRWTKGNVPFSRESDFASTLRNAGFFLVFFLPNSGRVYGNIAGLGRTIGRLAPNKGVTPLALFRAFVFEAGGVLLPAFALLMGLWVLRLRDCKTC